MQCSLVSSAVWSFELLSNSRELDERHDWYSLPCALHQWGVRLSIHTGNKCSGSSPSCSMYNVFATYSTTYVHSCKNIIVFMPLFCSHIHLELLNLLQRWQIGESRSEGRKKKKKQTDNAALPVHLHPAAAEQPQLLHLYSRVPRAPPVELSASSVTAALLWLVSVCQMLISCQQLCTARERER